MRYLFLFLFASSLMADSPPRDAAGNVIIRRDDSGYIIGPSQCQPSDPRRLLVTLADHTVMFPYYDSRGAPRWQYSAGTITYVQPTDRASLDPERVRQAITDYLTARGWLREATALGWNTSKPALYARIQAWVDEHQQAVTDALRAGQSSDDPTPPAKTTIAPISP